MAIFDTRLLRREPVADGTMAFHFAKPAGFRHQAGQAITITLIDPPETDAEGDIRTFTIASAPDEPDLMIATRMRDTAFKRVLGSAPIGTAVSFDGPEGTLVLPAAGTRPIALLAGGIGITPFLAMARHAARADLPHQLYLFYSNRQPEAAAFLDELHELARANANFRLIATMTEPEQSARPWPGETGFIRADMLARHLPDPKAALYYIAGPPAMTAAMQALLESIGVAPEAMRFEEFFGY